MMQSKKKHLNKHKYMTAKKCLDHPRVSNFSPKRLVFGGFFGAQISDPWRIQVGISHGCAGNKSSHSKSFACRKKQVEIFSIVPIWVFPKMMVP